MSNFLNLGMCNMCNSINAQYHSIDQNLHTFVRPSGVWLTSATMSVSKCISYSAAAGPSGAKGTIPKPPQILVEVCFINLFPPQASALFITVLVHHVTKPGENGVKDILLPPSRFSGLPTVLN